MKRFHGVGRAARTRWRSWGSRPGRTRRQDIAWLRAHFGSRADYLYGAARLDLRPVRSHRIRKSVGGDGPSSRTFPAAWCGRETLEEIIDIAWSRIERNMAKWRTVTLKLKYTDFQS